MVTAKQADNIMRKRVAELPSLLDGSIADVYRWSSTVLGEMLAMLSEASNEYKAQFEHAWTDNSPDREWVTIPGYEDYEVDCDLSDYDPSGYYHNPDLEQMLLGSRKMQDLSHRQRTRYSWMRRVFTLMHQASIAHSILTTSKGLVQDESLPDFNLSVPPEFQKYTGRDGDNNSIAEVMKSRWIAAENLQNCGRTGEAAILFGSLFEALLVLYIRANLSEEERKKFSNKDQVNRWSSTELITAAETWIKKEAIVQANKDIIFSFRHLIHILPDEKGEDADKKLRLHNSANENACVVIRACLKQLIDSWDDELRIPKP